MRTFDKLLACAMALMVPLCTWAQTEIEPNNSTTQATAVTYNTSMAGSTGACSPTDVSVDYFSFTPPQQGVMRIVTAMSNSGAADLNVSVVLRNSSGTPLQTFTATAGANSAVVNNTFLYTCAGTGVYYISIPNPSASVCTNYSLTYDMIAPVYANDVEPNQSTSQALDTLDAGVDYDGHLDFNYDNDFDYFRILAPNDGVLNVTVSAEHAGATTTDSIEVYLRNNSGSQLVIWKVGVGANGVPNMQTFTRTCTGTELVYFLEPHSPVRCGVSYRMSYTVTPPLYADDLEPNQSTTQALVANANTDYDGRLDFEYDNDWDYWRIQAPTDGVLNVTISAEHAGISATDSLEIRLRNNSGSQIMLWKVGVGANGVANTQVLTRTCTGTEQVYYLEPHSPVRCGVSYRFSYTVTPPLYADDLEPNQSTTQALVANANTDYDGRLDFEYDNDWDYWRIQAPTDGVLNVNISAEHAGTSTTDSLEVRLRNSSGSEIRLWKVGVGANGIANTQTLTRTCTGTEQVYYLEPHSPVRCGVSYRFSYTVTPPLFADDSEPNQSTAQATLIDLNAAPAFGRLTFDYDNDFDYFRVTHPGGQLRVTTSAENVGAAGTMTVYLRNSSGTPIVTNSSVAVGGGGIPASTTTQTAGSVAAGTYYIETYSPTICGVSYRLDCYDDDNDGVCNGSDLCAATPTGEGVNSDGCSCSQVTISDGNACTTDNCADGIVTHDPVSTDDSNVCTTDGCDPVTGVFHNAVSTDDGNACTIDGCDPVTGVFHNAVSTDDSNACTTDGCDPVTGVFHNAVSTDDSNACTTDGCDPVTGVFHNAVNTDDSNACTTDGCDPVTGVFHNTVNTDDSNACTTDGCDPVSGIFHNPVSTDDGNACTTDGCDPVSGVFHAAVNCDDGNPCTTDGCDPVSGCYNNGPVSCDDGNACTIDTYDCGTSQCVHTPVSTDDSNACTTDGCDPVTGVFHNPVSTDDGNACTTDGCDPVTGVFHTPVSTDDSNACTTDGCDPVTGVFHNALSTDDSNACTTDGCDPVTGVFHTPVNCDDGNPCTTDGCDPVSGCYNNGPVSCDDGNACTIDTYDCGTSQCVHTPVNTDDSNACTTDGCDPVTGVFHNPVSTDDGNACTTDGCDPVTGVFHDAVSTDDSNACTTDGCDPVTGVFHNAVSTDDGNACTTDGCDPVTGVFHSNVTDGTSCGVGFQCVGGVCTPIGGCTENLTLSITLDNFGSQTTWILYDQTETTVVDQGGPYANGIGGTVVVENICVSAGCYHLKVSDAGSNGMGNGGYVLRDAATQRIIDARTGTFGSVSEINSPGNPNRSFCVPIGPIGLRPTWCDNMNLKKSKPLVCDPYAGATGYRFWFYDPHGTYNRQVLVNTSNVVPGNLSTNPVPAGLDLNVRVAPKVGSTFLPFGPACRVRFRTGTAVVGANYNAVLEEETTFSLYPNPTHDQVVQLLLEGLDEGAKHISIDVIDAFGRSVHAEQFTIEGDVLNHALDMGADLAPGLYVVSVVVNDERFIQRLVIE